MSNVYEELEEMYSYFKMCGWSCEFDKERGLLEVEKIYTKHDWEGTLDVITLVYDMNKEQFTSIKTNLTLNGQLDKDYKFINKLNLSQVDFKEGMLFIDGNAVHPDNNLFSVVKKAIGK
ncbi:hypothetical protein [Vibrio casei]|uniref:hypothetical protein n=1 Tax=Vibrio casei TaxID=673372 RepID=UPI000DA65E31|nr:hypothetical protein [Vibrio casei]